MHHDTYPDDRTDPDAMRIIVIVTAGGVAVRTAERCGVQLVTEKQAVMLACRLRDAAWGGVFAGGGAVLSARPLESCVVVRCAGFASAAECEAFAAELERVAAMAGKWVKPELTPFGSKRKHKPEG